MHPEGSDALTLANRTNDAVNNLLLEHLGTPERLDAQTPGGGYTVAQHLAHLVELRRYWLSELRAGAADSLPRLHDPTQETFVAERDPARIRAVLTQVSAAVQEAVLTAPDMGQLPHASLAQFLTYLLVHDAHHRGQILLALKANGLPLPDEAALWSPWNS